MCRGGNHPSAAEYPIGNTVGADTKRFRIPENIGDGSGEILRGNGFAISCPVFQNEGIVAFLADLDGVRKAFVNRADVRKAAARGDDGEGSARRSPEEE